MRKNWRKSVIKRRLRSSLRKSMRLAQRRSQQIVICTLLLVLIVVINPVRLFMPPSIDPAAYKPLLNTIAAGESDGNYNAYYGHAGNTSIQFTDMSVGQVLQWQQQYVKGGSVSSAVGRYQILRPTLEGLVSEQHISLSARFDPALQDRLAINLMERRGSVAYVYKKLTPQQFAANLAKEWASLPRMTGKDPAASYYDGDGINASRVSIAAVNQAVVQLKDKAKDSRTGM
jgi:conjugal transfer mating pair stabilization protein TraG